MRDGAPSPQVEGEQERAAARLGFETRIAEAYAALEAMLEAEEESLPCETTEDWYDGTTGEGARQDTLPTKGKGTAKDKAEDPIVAAKARSGSFRRLSPRLQTLDNQTQAEFGRSREGRLPSARGRWLWTRALTVRTILRVCPRLLPR